MTRSEDGDGSYEAVRNVKFLCSEFLISIKLHYNVEKILPDNFPLGILTIASNLGKYII